MCNEAAVRIVEHYKEHWLMLPAIGWKNSTIHARLYQRWAADEIIEGLKTMNGSPIDIIETYIKVFDEWSCLGSGLKNEDRRFIFITARDIAEEILGLFLC